MVISPLSNPLVKSSFVSMKFFVHCLKSSCFSPVPAPRAPFTVTHFVLFIFEAKPSWISAFLLGFSSDRCGILVVVALLDMHECDGVKARLKKSMGGKVGLGVKKTSLVVKSGLKKKRGGISVVGIQDQPRSAFRCFMESFKKKCKTDNWLEIDMEGFNTWKNMSREERGQYVIEAEKVNSAYDKILQEEMEDMSEVDDEADSSSVGKFDVRYVKPTDYLSSSHWGLDKGYDDFDSSGWYSDSENTFLPNFGSI